MVSTRSRDTIIPCTELYVYTPRWEEAGVCRRSPHLHTLMVESKHSTYDLRQESDPLTIRPQKLPCDSYLSIYVYTTHRVC